MKEDIFNIFVIQGHPTVTGRIVTYSFGDTAPTPRYIHTTLTPKQRVTRDAICRLNLGMIDIV